jgi:hypothetical protein
MACYGDSFTLAYWPPRSYTGIPTKDMRIKLNQCIVPKESSFTVKPWLICFVGTLENIYGYWKTKDEGKNSVFWDITPCGSCNNDASEENIDSIIRLKRISDLGTLLVTSMLLLTFVISDSLYPDKDSVTFLRNVASYNRYCAPHLRIRLSS